MGVKHFENEDISCPRDGGWKAQGPMSTPIGTEGKWGVLGSKPEDVKSLLVILISQECVPLFSFLILLLSVLTLFFLTFSFLFHILLPPFLFLVSSLCLIIIVIISVLSMFMLFFKSILLDLVILYPFVFNEIYLNLLKFSLTTF